MNTICHSVPQLLLKNGRSQSLRPNPEEVTRARAERKASRKARKIAGRNKAIARFAETLNAGLWNAVRAAMHGHLKDGQPLESGGFIQVTRETKEVTGKGVVEFTVGLPYVETNLDEKTFERFARIVRAAR